MNPMEPIKRNWPSFLAAFIGIVGAGITCYATIKSTEAAIAVRVAALEKRTDDEQIKREGALTEMRERDGKLESAVAGITKQFEALNQRLGRIESQIDALILQSKIK